MVEYSTRKIGTDDVSAIGFGAMGISAYYGQTEPDEERFKVLDKAYELGCTFWDTANVYGDSEELIGKWYLNPEKRSKIFLATKFGAVTDGSGRGVDGSPKNVHESFAKSQKLLGVDQVQLYYLHRPDPETPIEETVGAMAELVKQGKVKYLGLSECTAATLRRAHKVHPIAAVQVEYSPFTLDIEDPKLDILNTAREIGIKIVAYSPLGRGLITGQYKSPDDFEADDFRRMVPRYSKENFPNILKLADNLKRIGEQYNATAGQVALAWLLAQGDDVIPIPGTKKIKYLGENLGAIKVSLSPESVQEVRMIAEKADWVVGERYPPAFMKSLYAETPLPKST
ncbi:NADP-dependent oxidoreductase domain-containing protein [Suillus paluster]|uniref:NADP-dependent oxidoreductase domain-containing protein n=1 Tax=Suillus paluster TaxID=48578 RepID=UPI001B881302|nr:NADP-dependent oxidoreductase domain-containing protein [Suillus paluster]KAG1741422.1 NADP-dependent oxidoreductase domain-containing protein [Suillus paluster]